MATKKKKSSKKRASKKRSAPSKKSVSHDKHPTYMVQVPEPKMLRRDVLEALREIIVFMQGYEKFRKIQEEKVATFTTLKTHVKELSRLIDHNLRAHFPKGKLAAMSREDSMKLEAREHPELIPKPEVAPPRVAPVAQPADTSSMPLPVSQQAPLPVTSQRSELDELEAQLADIEGQLKGIK
jgi:polyhydroxyalkanoate synthesis regulator phasin